MYSKLCMQQIDKKEKSTKFASPEYISLLKNERWKRKFKSENLSLTILKPKLVILYILNIIYVRYLVRPKDD